MREAHGPGKERMVWDAERRRPRAAPDATAAWLKQHAVALVAVGDSVAAGNCCGWF